MSGANLQGTHLADLAEEGTSSSGVETASAAASAPADTGKKAERSLRKSDSFRRALGPTLVCVYALLVLKTAQQGFVDSLPLFTVRLRSHPIGSLFFIKQTAAPRCASRWNRPVYTALS